MRPQNTAQQDFRLAEIRAQNAQAENEALYGIGSIDTRSGIGARLGGGQGLTYGGLRGGEDDTGGGGSNAYALDTPAGRNLAFDDGSVMVAGGGFRTPSVTAGPLIFSVPDAYSPVVEGSRWRNYDDPVDLLGKPMDFSRQQGFTDNALFGGSAGVAASFGKMALGGARILNNTIMQVGDILTGGYNHDHPVMKQVWAEQRAVGTGIWNAVTRPRETTTNGIESVVNRYNSAMAQGNDYDRSYGLGELFNDVGQGVVGGGAAVRNVARFGAAYIGEDAFVGSSGGRAGASSQLGAINLNNAPPTGATFDGTLYRAVGAGYDPLQIHAGNIANSHRYTGPGQGGLYFATGEHVVAAEFVNNGGSLAGTQMHAFPNTSVSNLLDVSNSTVRNSLGISLDELTRTGGTQAWRYEVTQPLGSWAQQNGYQGIIAPSAQANGGVNLILFDAKGVK